MGCCKNNDLDALEKLVNELQYYKVNAQKNINGNTALHISGKYCSDKACLFLVKKGLMIILKIGMIKLL
jgi:ankyrin repeat protein